MLINDFDRMDDRHLLRMIEVLDDVLRRSIHGVGCRRIRAGHVGVRTDSVFQRTLISLD